jgi:hypothetical protein
VPLYARLAISAFGDPAFRLRDMPAAPFARMLRQDCEDWTPPLRTHAVLRAEYSESMLDKALAAVPESLRKSVEQWLSQALQNPPFSDEQYLIEMDRTAFTAPDLADCERLSMHGLVLIEKLHRSGIETLPISIRAEEEVGTLLAQAHFLARLGGALWDMGFNGLGNSLLGRIITVDQNDAHPGAPFLRQGREKLQECEDLSPFVHELRVDDARILSHFGLQA